MAVLIDNRQKKYKIPLKKIQAEAQAILNALACPDGELSILIVDDPQIASLNQTYLRRQGPTNVIAFPMREGEFSNLTPNLLGDVVISIETAAREGRQAGLTREDRCRQLLIHGILHLFGFDHEKNDEQARLMDQKAEALLAYIHNRQG